METVYYFCRKEGERVQITHCVEDDESLIDTIEGYLRDGVELGNLSSIRSASNKSRKGTHIYTGHGLKAEPAHTPGFQVADAIINRIGMVCQCKRYGGCSSEVGYIDNPLSWRLIRKMNYRDT